MQMHVLVPMHGMVSERVNDCLGLDLAEEDPGTVFTQVKPLA
jgi:hypothetical protein